MCIEMSIQSLYVSFIDNVSTIHNMHAHNMPVHNTSMLHVAEYSV